MRTFSSGEADMDEPAPAASTDPREHRKRPVDTGPPPVTRQRVVLLPHGRTEPTDTRHNKRRTDGP
jgi:hypothetical protein